MTQKFWFPRWHRTPAGQGSGLFLDWFSPVFHSGLFHLNSTVVVPAISPIKTVPLPATSQMTINMYCTYVLDCGHFYAHYSDQAYETAEQHMTQAINHNEGRNLKVKFLTPVSLTLWCLLVVLSETKECGPAIVDWQLSTY